MDYLDVAGLRLAYERAGHGPPLVLVHGFVGDGRSTWSYQIDGLSDEFTVIAWDGPGAGGSSDPPVSFRMSDSADCLAGFGDASGLGRVHVVGLSSTSTDDLYGRERIGDHRPDQPTREVRVGGA